MSNFVKFYGIQEIYWRLQWMHFFVHPEGPFLYYFTLNHQYENADCIFVFFADRWSTLVWWELDLFLLVLGQQTSSFSLRTLSPAYEVCPKCLVDSQDFYLNPVLLCLTEMCGILTGLVLKLFQREFWRCSGPRVKQTHTMGFLKGGGWWPIMEGMTQHQWWLSSLTANQTYRTTHYMKPI